MKCLMKYQWVKLPRNHLPEGKGIMNAWAKLASRAAFRKGQASYCGHINAVSPGMWSGGVVGLKSILGSRSRVKSLEALSKLSELGYVRYSLNTKTKKLISNSLCQDSISLFLLWMAPKDLTDTLKSDTRTVPVRCSTIPPSLLPLVEIIRYSRTSTEVNGMQFTVRLLWIADPSLKTVNPFMTVTTCERSMLIQFAINQRLPVMESLKPEMMAKSSLLSVRGKTMATAESVFPVRLFAS